MNIAVLISGGVDSAVVVHKLKEEGHDLNLFYIRIGMDNGEGDCSAEEDIEMCSLIAKKYGLSLEVVSLHQEYWDNVMEYALRTVKAGLTPNPDMMCNKMIKFGYFEQRWGKDFDITATGHYASTEFIDGTKYLATAVDPVKDQTDFLAQISYDQLMHLTFPLGTMPKSDVRQLAIDAKLPNAYRKDSQGICFLGKINYNDFIRRHLGEKKGNIIELETGKKIGEHKGFWFHTIGQRKGLGLSGGPWFVVKKNVQDNTIYVSNGYETEKQYGKLIHIDEMHFISGNPWEGVKEPVDIMFKNRHTPEFLRAKLTHICDGEYVIESEKKVQGIAPGQFAVIYDATGHLCYGSGVITGQKVKD
ncbi:MAG: tRNA 2-thiouridine(34) synthase MnmA [Bacteroidales bacterium]|nr:tRNA 2-thiouridine(34) synthase MnmA [Bacteroidales bacterium]